MQVRIKEQLLVEIPDQILKPVWTPEIVEHPYQWTFTQFTGQGQKRVIGLDEHEFRNGRHLLTRYHKIPQSDAVNDAVKKTEPAKRTHSKGFLSFAYDTTLKVCVALVVVGELYGGDYELQINYGHRPLAKR